VFLPANSERRVKVGLQVMFRENPGNVVDFNFGHNLRLSPYGFAQFGAFIALALLCARNWAEKPAFLKSAVWMLLPLVGLTFFLGYMDEYRDYYEIYPVVVFLVVPVAAEFLHIEPFKVRHMSTVGR